MIVVSDTSAINNLASINQLNLLHQLYGNVIIPTAVYKELTETTFPVPGATEVQTYSWISIRSVTNQAIVELLETELDPGELEAIALAVEMSADQLLLDERKGRAVAERLNLPYTGVLGILIEAKSQKLIPEVKPLLDMLIHQAGFWVAESLYDQVLKIAGEYS
ncbi:MAG: DUF3368 domain-containing protein [Okeania sp. SIO3B5]|uniref:DUF3368 domain-containing protein n=1 Tax=Okeania sp. SIO3B5 TaxID=2607811 RepID=UPI0013FF98C2|nr:DUF3368 domain-containing protein [Okeania sp. SIO3B5]NEO52671.1 DUF3368 domain-containing protein [Okeania sp. SIO3B5]